MLFCTDSFHLLAGLPREVFPTGFAIIMLYALVGTSVTENVQNEVNKRCRIHTLTYIQFLLLNEFREESIHVKFWSPEIRLTYFYIEHDIKALSDIIRFLTQELFESSEPVLIPRKTIHQRLVLITAWTFCMTIFFSVRCLASLVFWEMLLLGWMSDRHSWRSVPHMCVLFCSQIRRLDNRVDEIRTENGTEIDFIFYLVFVIYRVLEM